MIWVLVVLLVVVPTALVVVLALGTKRHVAGVAREVRDSLDQTQARVDRLRGVLPEPPPACPTCGQPEPGAKRSLTFRTPAGSPDARAEPPAGVG